MADDIPTVRWGSKGATVALLQTTLNAFQAGRRDALVADGIFGKLTYAAVRTFQRDNGLEVDGIVGPKTWGKLAAHGKIDPAVYGPKPAPPAAAPAKAAEEAPAGPTIAKAPPLSYTGFAEQQTQDDCGYFASYALAKCTEKKSLEIRFTKEDVLTELNIFVDREEYRQAYLTSNRVPDFMAQLGTSG
ncbi:MAG: peptidoglycan-binding protein [Rhodothalassiaceae bacterium]